MWNKLNKSMMFCQMMFGLSFYGVLVSLTRFFLEDLNYNEADTMMIVGAFSAIGPLFAIAGGFIADKFLGAYRSNCLSHSLRFLLAMCCWCWAHPPVTFPFQCAVSRWPAMAVA